MTETEAHKRYRLSEKGQAAAKRGMEKYVHSEHGKAKAEAYRDSPVGKASQSRRSYKYNQSDHGKAVRKAYRQTPKGKTISAYQDAKRVGTEKRKISSARSGVKRRRSLGYRPINNKFSGSDGHHVNTTNVIFIPSELHRSIYHRQDNLESMKEINKVAFKFLYEHKEDLIMSEQQAFNINLGVE